MRCSPKPRGKFELPHVGFYELSMNWETIDWAALERMRAAFLAGTAGATDYWSSEADLAAYDATFAQRIGWKWDFVLGELQRRGWSPPKGPLLDWGCGSGVASRAFLDFFGANSISKLRVWDRSPLAMSFAARRAQEKFPQLSVEAVVTPESVFGGTLLISHVLTELTQEQTETLAALAATAECVVWVEPGTYEASLTLIAIREQLRGQFNLIAPCPHQERCGILAPENERHWCHHFAAPPAEIFTDSGWARFANLLGVDLRDLPLSFLVLDRRPAPQLPAGAARLIGHPRIYKGYALLLGCEATGVREQRLTQRVFPREFKDFKKGRHASLCQWRCRAGEVEDYQSLD
jgi:hypothetical protein